MLTVLSGRARHFSMLAGFEDGPAAVRQLALHDFVFVFILTFRIILQTHIRHNTGLDFEELGVCDDIYVDAASLSDEAHFHVTRPCSESDRASH